MVIEGEEVRVPVEEAGLDVVGAAAAVEHLALDQEPVVAHGCEVVDAHVGGAEPAAGLLAAAGPHGVEGHQVHVGGGEAAEELASGVADVVGQVAAQAQEALALRLDPPLVGLEEVSRGMAAAHQPVRLGGGPGPAQLVDVRKCHSGPKLPEARWPRRLWTGRGFG